MKAPQILRYSLPTFVVFFSVYYILYTHLVFFNLFSAAVILSIFSWLVGYLLFELNNGDVVSSQNKAVLITGCDTGFGHKLTLRLDKLGRLSQEKH